jgi:hypothetical protein
LNSFQKQGILCKVDVLRSFSHGPIYGEGQVDNKAFLWKRLGKIGVRSNPQRRREDQIAQNVRAHDHLGRGASAVSTLYPRAATAGIPSRR